MRENTIPVLLFLLLEDIWKQEADKIVGSSFALFGHKEDYKLYAFCCFDRKYFILEHKKDLVKYGLIIGEII